MTTSLRRVPNLQHLARQNGIKMSSMMTKSKIRNQKTRIDFMNAVVDRLDPGYVERNKVLRVESNPITRLILRCRREENEGFSKVGSSYTGVRIKDNLGLVLWQQWEKMRDMPTFIPPESRVRNMEGKRSLGSGFDDWRKHFETIPKKDTKFWKLPENTNIFITKEDPLASYR